MTKARNLADNALTTVSPTELGYLDGVTSAVQTQINSKIGQSTAINPTIVDAKGDIIAATAADTVDRLAVGANDTVLTADSSAATGLKWATPAAGGMTLLSTTNLSGTTTTVSSINQTHSELLIVVTGAVNSDFFAKLDIRANGSNTLSKTSGVIITTSLSYYSTNTGRVIDSNVSTTSTYLRIPNYASTTIKKQGFFTSSNNDAVSSSGSYFYDSTSAITSISVTTTAGTPTFTAGQIQIYGVK